LRMIFLSSIVRLHSWIIASTPRSILLNWNQSYWSIQHQKTWLTRCWSLSASAASLLSCVILFWTSFWVAQISSTLFAEWTETAMVARGCDCMFAMSMNYGKRKLDEKYSQHSVHSQGHNLPADVAKEFLFCAWSTFHTNL
jgi:hypothetical protein